MYNKQLIKNIFLQMPVILKIDSHRKVVYSTFYGKVTDEEFLRHGARIAADPDFRKDFSEIVDFTDVTQANISETTLTTIANTRSLYSESVLHILVAPDDSLFGLAERYRNLTRKSRPNLFVVRTRAEAYKLVAKRKE